MSNFCPFLKRQEHTSENFILVFLIIYKEGRSVLFKMMKNYRKSCDLDVWIVYFCTSFSLLIQSPFTGSFYLLYIILSAENKQHFLFWFSNLLFQNCVKQIVHFFNVPVIFAPRHDKMNEQIKWNCDWNKIRIPW